MNGERLAVNGERLAVSGERLAGFIINIYWNEWVVFYISGFTGISTCEGLCGICIFIDKAIPEGGELCTL